jgi:hypothetical protein
VAEAEATIEAPVEPVEAAPEAPDADAATGADPVQAAKPAKAAKEKKPKPGKKDKGKAPAEPPGDGPSVAAHPRAARAVERAKGWGALGGFLLGGYLSLPTHTLADAGLRALVAGVVLYVAAWAGALFFWRRMVVLEIKAREQQLLAAAAAARAARGAADARPPQGQGAAR